MQPPAIILYRVHMPSCAVDGWMDEWIQIVYDDSERLFVIIIQAGRLLLDALTASRRRGRCAGKRRMPAVPASVHPGRFL